jgi:hypothetical protein
MPKRQREEMDMGFLSRVRGYAAMAVDVLRVGPHAAIHSWATEKGFKIGIQSGKTHALPENANPFNYSGVQKRDNLFYGGEPFPPGITESERDVEAARSVSPGEVEAYSRQLEAKRLGLEQLPRWNSSEVLFSKEVIQRSWIRRLLGI